MSKNPTRDADPIPAGAGVQWDIEESKRFALSLGMSPEQVADLYDSPTESPAEESPPPSPPSPPPPHANEPTSKYRVAFLVWWTNLVLFISIFMYVNRDLVPTETFFASLAVVIFAFGSWIPGAFLRFLRPEQSP
jgi:hypothetical protein